MDLISDHPFWPLNSGLIRSYPSLKTDLKCEVLILGAVITGALCAYHLIKAGMDVTTRPGATVGAKWIVFATGYFTRGFGGNGITYSIVAVEITGDTIQGKKHSDARLFQFDR